MGLLSAGSFSRLNTYKKCPAILRFQAIDRIKQPMHPAAERGNTFHAIIAEAVQGEPEDYSRFLETDEKIKPVDPAFLSELTQGFKAGKVLVEQTWAVDRNWKLLQDKFDKRVWRRDICDVVHFISSGTAVVYDWKTGKWDGKQVEHTDQAKQYAVALMQQFPDIEQVITQFIYVDHAKFGPKRTWKRSMLPTMLAQLETRMDELTNDEALEATPSKWTCKYCFYGTEGYCKDKWDE